MLDARNLIFKRRRRTILDGIDCRLYPGELVLILGCNGAGKSTLLSLLSGDQNPDRGTVELNGRALHAWGTDDLARTRAVMPQLTPLSFPFLAGEIVAMGRMPHGDSPERTADAVQACLIITQSTSLQHRPYTELSGGEKQRIHLARVLAQLWPFTSRPPGYLFLDEATSSLDPQQQQRVFQQIRTVCDADIGVMAVVHDINLASQFADRILLLDQGRLLASGSPTAALTPDNIATAYSGYQVQVHHLPGQPAPWLVPLT